MKHRISLALLVIFALVALAACGNSAPPDGYLSKDSGGVYWLQMVTSSSGDISGSYTSTILESGKIQTAELTVTGTENNNKLSITFHVAALTETANGTVDGNTITLTMLNSSGQQKTRTFTSDSTSDYQSAVTAFTNAHKS